jgi:hypothetical protein
MFALARRGRAAAARRRRKKLTRISFELEKRLTPSVAT